LPAEEVLRSLQVNERGLTTEEAQHRLRIYGPNRLREALRPGLLARFWDQINSFVVWLLIVASVISALLGDTLEAGAILAIVVLNAVLGVIQERRAEEALAALKKLSAPGAQVLRDGHRLSIPAENLVPGDIVFLETGNYVPADVRLLEAINLRVEEASLTGESIPVQKSASAVLEKNVPLGDRKNTAFMGTLVVYGRGRGVVISTGMNTQLGLIAQMLQTVEQEVTPLQRRLDHLGRTLSIGALILAAIIFLVALVNYTDVRALLTDPLTYFRDYARSITAVFIIAISLAIAAVPEGLPAVVTISLALGMREMVRRHALIRRLSSVETLGSVTVICSDKTGTLTQNEMTVTRLWVDGYLIGVTGNGYVSQGEFILGDKVIDLNDYPGILTLLWLGVLNNDAQLETIGEADQRPTFRVVGDPTEGALLVAAAKAGASCQAILEAYPRQNEIPFDSERKRMITVHEVLYPQPNDFSTFRDKTHKGWDVIIVKGAPDGVLDLCKYYQTINDEVRPLDDRARQRILDANNRMASDALRVLGLAYRLEPDVPDRELWPEEVEHDLIFVGLVGMIDPARVEVAPALEKARQAGIRTVMITGDYPNTARAIAESVGLMKHCKGILTGAQLEAMDDDQLKNVILDTAVFARVSPDHKMRIVDALQAKGEVVAMTGDGVNDAPAIKRADIGIAMGITGTDVAKQTADMVLTDDNYASIVAAVEQGRIIYSNIRKFVFFLLSSNLAEIMIIFLATLGGLPSPLTAIQLLWLNLITDGAPALALAMEKGDPDIMKQKPRAKNEPIINQTMRLGLLIQTIVQTAAVLTAFSLGLLWHLEAGAFLPADENPIRYILQHNWQGVDVQTAETMAFVALSLCQLFRAYTVRSEKVSIFQLGVFSNRYMQYAIAFSIGLMLLVVNVFFLQPIFNTHFMSGREWLTVLGLALLPAIAEEITKFFLRRRASLGS